MSSRGLAAAMAAATALSIAVALPAGAHVSEPTGVVEWVDPQSPEAQGSARNTIAVGSNTIGGRGSTPTCGCTSSTATSARGASRTTRRTGRDIAVAGIQVCGGSRYDTSFFRGLQVFDVTTRRSRSSWP